MRWRCSLMKATMVTLSYFVIGCSLSEQNTKTAPVNFITTPASYYSTAKARYLGMKYKENLDRLAERIVRNPKTADLQFANNISSLGGIGFFTHSATNAPDERYLEVIVSAPDTFEKKEVFNAKVARMFASYGTELLSILASDPAIYQEDEVSGYGLNLTWRSLVQDSTGSRIVPEGVVMYFKKVTVEAFLHQSIDQHNFLAGATIFAMEGNGPPNLISYRQPRPGADTRLPIREEALSEPQTGVKTESRPLSQAAREAGQPLAVAGQKRSTANTTVVPMTAAEQPSAGGKGQGLGAMNKSPQAAKEGAGAVKEERDIANDGPSESAKSSGHATRSTSVTKQPEEPSNSHQAEQQGNTSQVSKVDKVRRVKPTKDERKSASSEISTPAAGKAKTPAMNETQPQRGIARELTSETSKTAGKSIEEKEASAFSKTAAGVQASPVKVAQPEVKKKFEPLASEQVGLARKNPVADSQEPPRQVVSALPAQGSRIDMAKTRLNPVAKNPARDAPQGGKISEVSTPRTEADKGAPGKSHEAPVVATSTVKAQNMTPLPAISTAKENSPSRETGPANEQIARLKSSAGQAPPEKRAVARLQAKALEGYIIQVAFDNKDNAQRWAETLERRGYAVSVTQADGAGPVRLRLGNFSVREEAERQLKSLKQEGLSGIVINLPEAYRPEVRVPASGQSQAQAARTDN